MSVCKDFGKDKVIFATKEDHSTPSTVVLPPSEPPTGLITPDGEINWNCPCLGGMATGPCGVEFREAFSCFHYSEAEPKGSNCYEAFKTMQECFAQYPTVYNKSSGDDDDDVDIELAAMTGDPENQITADTANLVVDEKTSSAIPSSSTTTTPSPSPESNTSSSSSGAVDKLK